MTGHDSHEPNPFRAMLDGWDESKWVQRKWHEEDRSCLYHRMERIVSPLDRPSVELALTMVLLDQYGDRILPGQAQDPAKSFPEFNDHYLTTFDDVRAVVEKAAVRWDERV